MISLDHREHPLEPTRTETEALRNLRSIRFRQVVAHVHDTRIVQIERADRFRADARIPDTIRSG